MMMALVVPDLAPGQPALLRRRLRESGLLALPRRVYFRALPAFPGPL